MIPTAYHHGYSKDMYHTRFYGGKWESYINQYVSNLLFCVFSCIPLPLPLPDVISWDGNGDCASVQGHQLVPEYLVVPLLLLLEESRGL
jgi:hypothetical protein